jgi:hypothetical protein
MTMNIVEIIGELKDLADRSASICGMAMRSKREKRNREPQSRGKGSDAYD